MSPIQKGYLLLAEISGFTAFLEGTELDYVQGVIENVVREGTQTGPLEGPTGTIPASGKRQVTPSAWIFTFEGEKIKESHNYFDMLTLLVQIGAIQGKRAESAGA